MKNPSPITPVQAATLLIRISGLGCFISALVVSTYLPISLISLVSAPAAYASQRVLPILMEILRIAVYLGTGTCFLLFAAPLGRLFAKGLESVEENSQ